MFDDCIISENIVGHVPFNWSKLVTKFLQFPNHHIRVVVTETRMNQGAEFDLEILLDCIFCGDSQSNNVGLESFKDSRQLLNVKEEKVVK